MDKRLLYPSNLGKERDTFFVREDRNYLRKHASAYHPKIAEYIEKAKPLPNLVQVLLTALGAGEYWGSNVNADYFPAAALSHSGEDYGHSTFLTLAKYFLHHVNKDPALAKGDVLHAVWNEKTKRVELIVGINPALDPDGAAAVENGENLAFSMGCKVPYDICSICGNRARIRAEYCEHLRYMPNQIDPGTGKLACAINTLPRFFDISRVLIPADKTAYMWAKVAGPAMTKTASIFTLGSAHLAEVGFGSLQKVASELKKAEITKRVPVIAKPSLVTRLEELVGPTKKLLEENSPSLTEADVDLIHAATAGDRKKLAASFLSLAMLPRELELRGPMPANFSGEDPCPATLAILAKYASERSYSRPILAQRLLALEKKAQTVHELSRSEQNDRKAPVSTSFMAGLLTALYVLFGPHAEGGTQGIARLIADHPFVTAALGAGALRATRGLSSPTQSGIYSVDDPNQGLYNNNWQSRFARMQARPVTVIKTGSSHELADRSLKGIPLLWLLANPLEKTSTLAHDIYQHQSYGLLKEGADFSSRLEELVRGGERVFKTASIRDPDFIRVAPEEMQDSLWDLVIVDSAARITKKLGGN